MTLKITANEFFVHEGGARVKTRCVKSEVTDTMIAAWAQYNKLDAGDVIDVLCMTYERDTVLWERRYRIVSRKDFLRRTETLTGDVKHEDAFNVRVAPMTAWVSYVETGLTAVDKGPAHKWWVLDDNGATVARNLDKETAQAIASGEIEPPLVNEPEMGVA